MGRWHLETDYDARRHLVGLPPLITFCFICCCPISFRHRHNYPTTIPHTSTPHHRHTDLRHPDQAASVSSVPAPTLHLASLLTWYLCSTMTPSDSAYVATYFHTNYTYHSKPSSTHHSACILQQFHCLLPQFAAISCTPSMSLTTHTDHFLSSLSTKTICECINAH